jgi:hypothetical protein
MKKRTRRSATQLEFFQPPRVRPSWIDLPNEVQKEASELLVKMIREYLERSLKGPATEGKSDERIE